MSSDVTGHRPRTPLIAAIAMLLLGGLITGLGLRWQTDRERTDQREQLDTLTDDTSARIEATLLRYSDLLDGLTSFQASSDRTIDDYEAFVRSLDVRRVPGVDTTAYIARVPAGELAAFQAEQRATGQPGFTVQPAAAADHHAIVVYAAPVPSAAPGLDLFGDPVRAAALDEALDTGLPVVTGSVVPVAERALPVEQQSSVLLVYKAVYEPGAPTSTPEERRAAAIGWSAVPVTVPEVLASVRLDGGLLDVAVFDADAPASAVLAEGVPGAAERIAARSITDRDRIDTGSLVLEVRTAFAPGRTPPTSGWAIALGGGLATLLAAYGVFASLRFRGGLLAHAEADRQQAELLRSRFHAAVHRAPVGVTVVGLDGTVQLVNDRLRELLRVPEAGVGLSIFDYYQPEERVEAAQQVGRLARGEVEGIVRDRQLVRADGSLLWCRISSSWVPGPDGRPNAIVGHVQDIEAERQAVDELRSRTRWFSSIVERSSDLILLLDRDHRITWVSPSLTDVLSVAEEDLLDNDALGFIEPSDRARVGEAFRTVESGQVARVEFRVTDRSGALVWLETTATNLLDDPDVASIITLSRDVTERHQRAELLAHRAAHDPLTGLLNRAELEGQLAAGLAQRADRNEPVTLAYLDLDGFKAVNDSYGHAAGDDLLRITAGCLQEEVRTHDLIARLGGDEFVLVLWGATLTDALEVAERIRRRLHAPLSIPKVSQPVEMSVSVGLAVATPTDDVQSLLHAADVALYEAKRRGRDRVEVSARGVAELGAEVDELLDGVLRDPD